MNRRTFIGGALAAVAGGLGVLVKWEAWRLSRNPARIKREQERVYDAAAGGRGSEG